MARMSADHESFQEAIGQLLRDCRTSLRARALARSQHGLVYVRTYTVKAHFRKYRPRKKRRK